MTDFTPGQFVEWRSPERRVGFVVEIHGSGYIDCQPIGSDCTAMWREHSTTLRPWKPIPGELCEGDALNCPGHKVRGQFERNMGDGALLTDHASKNNPWLASRSTLCPLSPPAPAPAVDVLPKGTRYVHESAPGSVFELLEDARVNGWKGAWIATLRETRTDGTTVTLKDYPFMQMFITILPPEKPSPPPPIADGEIRRCDLCDEPSCRDPRRDDILSPDRFETGERDIGDVFFCATHWRTSWTDEERGIVRNRRKKLLAKDSPGSVGSVDAAHRETAAGSASAQPVVRSTQPAGSARPTPKFVEPDPYQNFPHGMNDAQVAAAMSAIDARRSRHHAEVLREIDTRRTFTDKMGVVRTWDGRRVKP